jgi:hypothetical protein
MNSTSYVAEDVLIHERGPTSSTDLGNGKQMPQPGDHVPRLPSLNFLFQKEGVRHCLGQRTGGEKPLASRRDGRQSLPHLNLVDVGNAPRIVLLELGMPAINKPAKIQRHRKTLVIYVLRIGPHFGKSLNSVGGKTGFTRGLTLLPSGPTTILTYLFPPRGKKVFWTLGQTDRHTSVIEKG